MELMFIKTEGENTGMIGGGFINNLLHLNKPERNFQNFVEELTGSGLVKENNVNTKYTFIPASKTKDLHKS
jgi:hypothetical protein